MLLANMAVARKIHRSYPDMAMLRRHPEPQTKQLDELVGTVGYFRMKKQLVMACPTTHDLDSLLHYM